MQRFFCTPVQNFDKKSWGFKLNTWNKKRLISNIRIKDTFLYVSTRINSSAAPTNPRSAYLAGPFAYHDHLPLLPQRGSAAKRTRCLH
jgi:hypothetical protein